MYSGAFLDHRLLVQPRCVMFLWSIQKSRRRPLHDFAFCPIQNLNPVSPKVKYYWTNPLHYQDSMGKVHYLPSTVILAPLTQIIFWSSSHHTFGREHSSPVLQLLSPFRKTQYIYEKERKYNKTQLTEYNNTSQTKFF